jgi:hypothetical protein
VDLILSHFTPRYVATGVDPNDLHRLAARMTRWDDWCRLWSEAALLHERLAAEASARGHRLTAAEAFLRAAIYYHYGKHLFADRPDDYAAAQASMLRCYAAAAPSEGERLARAASGPTEFVVYDEGNHVCFNIPYKFRPLTADWMAETLGARRTNMKQFAPCAGVPPK